MKRLIGLLILCAALAGCTGPQPPTYNTDAFKGIYNQNSAAVPADVPVTVKHPVAVILSDNFEIYFSAVKAADEYWGKIVPTSLTNTVVIADHDPTFLAGRVLADIKTRFPEAQEVKDFQSAVSSGKKAVVLVDVMVHLMEPYSDRTTKFDITYYFFDSSMNPVSKITGHGERNIPIGAPDGGVQVSVDAAIAQLDQKMAALIH